MNDEINDNAYEKAVDEKAAKEDIAAGSRALKNLQKTAGHNWSNGWSIVIRGWRGLREMAFLRSRSRDAKTQAYRDAMGVLLAQAQNIDYRNIPHRNARGDDQADRPHRRGRCLVCDPQTCLGPGAMDEPADHRQALPAAPADQREPQ